MTTELRIDGEKNIAYIKVLGSAGSRDILDAFDMAVESPDYRDGMGRLWDFTEIDISALDGGTIREMAKYSLRFPPGIRDVKVGFVVTETMAYGLTRMFQSYSDSYAETLVRLFRDMESAEEWMKMGPER